MISRCIHPGQRPGTLALAIIASLLGSSVAAWATTKLEITIAGEPWKDPSIAAVGPALTLATPPGPPPNGGTLALGWSTTESHAMGVNWQVKKNGTVVASGTAPLTAAAVPARTYWIFIPAKFLAPQPPTTAVTYQITVTPYDATNKVLGAASPPVIVTQVADKSKPGPIFGAAAVFPTLELVSYLPNYGQTPLTQLFHELGTLTVRAHNKGNVPTNQMMLSVTDFNAIMRQDGVPVMIPSLAPGATMQQPITLHLKGILPPARSQTPEDQQFTEWQRSYAQRCGVDLRGVMDLDIRNPKSADLMNGHSEVRLFKGIGSSINFEMVKPEVPFCDSKQCVLMSDVAKSIRSQLDSKVVGYAFFLAGCSSVQYGAHGDARTAADSPAASFTTTTKMTVASISKVVTALAAIRAIGEKEKADFNLKNGLDSVIGPFLPPWNWGSADQEKIAKITFRQLLSQTSGVRNYGNVAMDYATLKKFFTKPVATGNGPCGDSSIKDIDGVNPAIVTDKTTPCYSNLNFAIFRVLLPRIMGYAGDDEDEYAARYVQIVRDKVFTPLGITDVDCRPPSKGTYALGYAFPGTSSGHDFGDRRPTCGGEGWYLSVEDLGHVLLSLNGADGRILTEAQFRDMETNPSVHAVGWDATSSSGFRWVEKNGALGDSGRKVNTSIAIFGSSNTDPYVSGAVGVLFVNSNIADPPGMDVSSVLFQAFANASKPKH